MKPIKPSKKRIMPLRQDIGIVQMLRKSDGDENLVKAYVPIAVNGEKFIRVTTTIVNTGQSGSGGSTQFRFPLDSYAIDGTYGDDFTGSRGFTR